MTLTVLLLKRVSYSPTVTRMAATTATATATATAIACSTFKSKFSTYSTTYSSASSTIPTKLANNPLLKCRADLPKFAHINSTDIEPAMNFVLDDFFKELKNLENKIKPKLNTKANLSWEEVMTTIELLSDKMETPVNAMLHLSRVKSTPSLQDEVNKVQGKIVLAGNALRQSKILYDAKKRLLEQDHQVPLSKSQKHQLTKSLEQSMLGGVSLPEEERKKFNVISSRLADLSNLFSQNVISSSARFALVLTEKSQVESLSIATLEMLAANERNSGNTTATAEKGPWRVNLSPSCISAVFGNCSNRQVRKQLQYAVATRASDIIWDKAVLTPKASTEDGTKFNNLPLITEILDLQHELAKLLGYESYAELSLATKMAPSVAAVGEMLFKINEQARVVANKEKGVLEKLFSEIEGSEAKLAPWDISYLIEQDSKRSLSFNQEELRPYLRFDKVLQALFDLSSTLFGIKIEPVALSKDYLWDEYVQFFQVKDIKSQKTIAGFFLDPYSRTGEKRGGAWMDVVVSRSSSVFLNLSEDEKLDVLAKQGQNSSSEFSLWTKSENSSSSSSSSSSASSSSSSSPSSPMRRLPVAHLVCNQPPPHPYPGVTGTVSLMNWTEVETLFHEFGHGLHHMLTQVNESEISGVNGVEWDAVELPSQFMERWCSLPSVLSTMVEHVATKEKLDTEKLSQTLEKVKTHMNGITTLNQLRYGVMDMFLYGANLLPSHPDVANEEKMFLNSLSKHISHPIGVQDVLAVQRAIASRFSVVTPIPDDRFLCSFSHIFGGGYSAGYYSYKWAEILCFDAFEAFKERLDQPNLNESEKKAILSEIGLKYRNTILASGGSQPALEVFKAFRGREPSLEPFFKAFFGSRVKTLN